MEFIDENFDLPKQDCICLCKVLFFENTDYVYQLIDFKNGVFQITDTCEHIYWCELPKL